MNQPTHLAQHADGRQIALTVLVAEDNRVNQLLARKALTSAGHTVVIAEHGQAAVDILVQADCRFDLILMDCQMPIMDGFEATAKIRELQSSGHLPPMPIVAVTAMDMGCDPNGTLPPGFDNYLVKPYSTTDLIQLVEQQAMAGEIAEPSDLQQSPTSGGDLPFDIDALLNACQGDTDMAENLIEVFRQNGDECLSQIESGIQSEDFAVVRASAHSLKGAAGMLGANFVCRLATRLEEFDDSNSDLNRMLDELAAEFDRCRGFRLAIV
jgi:two-component system sensor histidine kinase/response regulator